MRWSEIALFLAPFVVFGAWWQLGLRGLRLFWSVLGLVVVLLALLLWLALTSGLPRSGGYVPARVQDGRIVPGHGA